MVEAKKKYITFRDSEQTFDPDPRLLTIDQRIHEAFAELMFMFVFDHQQKKEQCQIAIKINDKVQRFG